MSDWPTSSMDWRNVRPGDQVRLITASESPVGRDGFEVRPRGGGPAFLATYDYKSEIMALHHLRAWAKAGKCYVDVRRRR